MFSKTCEYAIKAMLYLQSASAEGRSINLKAIAEHIDSPEAFTAKILQQLRRRQLLHSSLGTQGGFKINPDQTIYLADIVSAIDGPGLLTGCALGLKQCSEQMPCPLHNDFKRIRNDLKNMLEKTSLQSIASDILKGNTHLKL